MFDTFGQRDLSVIFRLSFMVIIYDNLYAKIKKKLCYQI